MFLLRLPLSPPKLLSAGLHRSVKGLNLKGLSFFIALYYSMRSIVIPYNVGDNWGTILNKQ
ncbi:hypothetical protein ABCA12_0220 [Acinetobacter junii]|nr:hypothetical protein ABCA12_0220 [Acinetobacter junii]